MKNKFNFKRGSATPKGKLHTLRLIIKDHSCFDDLIKANKAHDTLEMGEIIKRLKREAEAKQLRHLRQDNP
jgi:hypothetical protein